MNYEGHALSTSPDQSRFTDILFAQTVRLVEEAGPLEDGEAMRDSFRSRAGREQRLLMRAGLLAQRLKLDQEYARWRELAVYIWIALAALVFLIAYGIAFAVIGGDRTINAVLAFFVALGVHGLTLLGWGYAVLVNMRRKARPHGRLSLGNLFLRLLAWLPIERGPHSLTMMRAATNLLHRARLLPWALGLISHVIWALGFVLVLLALWFAFSFREYRLTWETTILSAEFFVRFVHLTGWLPNLIGFPLPDASTLLEPGAAGSDQRAWAWWLIGSTFVYGLLPRVVLAFASWAVWRRGQRALHLDTSDPYYRKLLVRFEDMETSTVVDPDQCTRPQPGDLDGLAASDSRYALAVAGFELPPEHRWPPALAASADLVERISGSGRERRAVLNQLAQARPQKLLIVCNSASSPDRGTERFIREACAHAVHCALLLEATSGTGEAKVWEDWLASTRLRAVRTFTNIENVDLWIGKADG
jgi:hypothetical protein